jgi:hypothetical protein
MTPAQLATLKNEVQTDPSGVGYASMDWQQQLAAINAMTTTMVQSISTDAALTWAASGSMDSIVTQSTANANQQIRASCLAFLHKLSYGTQIDMESSTMQTLFTAWVAASIITQTQHDALIAIATQPASRAQVLGLGVPNGADLAQAGV